MAPTAGTLGRRARAEIAFFAVVLVLKASTSAEPTKAASLSAPSPVWPSFAVGAKGVFNDRLVIQVNDGTVGSLPRHGRFNMAAFPDASGNEVSATWNIIAGYPFRPRASFASFRVDGADFVFVPSQTTVLNPTTVQSRQVSGDLELTQLLQIVTNPLTGLQDAAKITYQIRNNSSTTSHTVGTRMTIDTEVDDTNGAETILVPGAGRLTAEREFMGEAIPTSFHALYNLNDSTRVAGALFDGAGATRPDRVVFAYSFRVEESVYDYTVDPFREVDDHSYLVYWNPAPVPPLATSSYVTYYGLSDLDADFTGALDVGVTAPAELSVNAGQYSPNPLDVLAYTVNTGGGPTDGTRLTLNLPAGLSLASGTATQTIGTLEQGQDAHRSWRISAARQTAPTTFTYSVTAEADGVPSSTVSRQLTVPVAGAASSVALASLPNPSTVGQSVTFTATVSGSGVTPTGTVTLRDGATTLETAPVVSGVATFNTASLTAGLHNITAEYSGDVVFVPSSDSVTHAVNTAATTTALQSSVNPSAAGQPVTFTATVTPSGSGTPSGTVTFRDGSTTLGTVSLSGGVAAFTTSSPLSLGPHGVTADYSGDGSFARSSGSLTQTVDVAATTTALRSSANPSVAGQPVTFTATVTSSGPGTPTGTVTFRDGNTTLETVPLSGGVAAFTTSSLAAGAHTVTADYSGDAFFGSSSSGSLTPHTVNVVGTTTGLQSSVNPSTPGQPVTFTATVTSAGQGTPAGTVTLRSGATVLGTANVDGSGTAQVTATSLPAGTHTITADYSGSSVFQPSAGSLTQTVASAPTFVTVVPSPFISTLDQPVTLTATVTSTTPGVPTGTVAFRNGATVLGEAALDASGKAAITTSALSVGVHQITVAYAGDASFQPGTGSVRLIVDRAPTITALMSEPASSTFGQAVTLTATVTPALAGTPGGTVTFRDGDTVLGEAPVENGGKAVFLTSALAAGTHTLTTTYGGDATFGPSSGSASHVVSKGATRLSVTASANPSVVSQPITFTATVTPAASGGAAAAGKVTFREGDQALGEGTLDESGKATLTLATLTGGTHAIAASYEGNSSYEPSTGSLSQSVNRATSNAAMTSSPNPSAPSEAITLIATVNAQAGNPTGTVTFRAGEVVLGEIPLDVGRATVSTSTLGVGTHTITAAYGGDKSFLPSIATVAQNVVALTVRASEQAPSTAGTTPGTPTAAGPRGTGTAPAAAAAPAASGAAPAPSSTPVESAPGVPAAVPATPSLSLFPAVANAGRVVEVSGTGFAPNAEVTLRWPVGGTDGTAALGPVAAVVTADAQGRFGPVSITVPSDGTGPRSITADSASASTASTPFLVSISTARPAGLGHILGARTRLIQRG